jgi:GH15 family glucan-1,4-alpha-glucosidase
MLPDYWRAHALVCLGRLDEAQDLLHQLDTTAGALGLHSEMTIAATGESVGNVPQALSHLTHINAAAALRAALAAERTTQPR